MPPLAVVLFLSGVCRLRFSIWISVLLKTVLKFTMAKLTFARGYLQTWFCL